MDGCGASFNFSDEYYKLFLFPYEINTWDNADRLTIALNMK